MLEIMEPKQGELHREYAKRVLARNIIQLKLEPGARLVEAELVQQIGVGRTPVREAILELQREGVVEIHPHQGTYVSRLDYQAAEDIRFLRDLVERELAAQACQLEDRQQILAQLQANVAMQRVYRQDATRFLELDDSFHEILYCACGRQSLHVLLEANAVSFDRLRYLSFALNQAELLIDEHSALIDAIERGDAPLAAELSRRHLRRVVEDQAQLQAKYPQFYMTGN